jgi:dienelactone hydrolase
MYISKNIVLTGSNGLPMLTDIFYKPEAGQKPVIIYLHGFSGFKDWGNFDLVARQFAEAGFVFIKFNLSHGGSTAAAPEDFADLEAYGNNNYSKELDDLQTIIDWAIDHANPHAAHMDANRLGLLAHSRGGGITIIKTAEEKKVRALVTWASVAACKTPWGSWLPQRMEAWKQTGVEYYENGRTKQQMPLYYQLYQDFVNNADRLSIERAIKKVDVPLLICHGTNDTAVPLSAAKQLKEWQPAAELFIAEGDHVFNRSHPWLEDDLPEAMQLVMDKTIAFYKSALQTTV